MHISGQRRDAHFLRTLAGWTRGGVTKTNNWCQKKPQLPAIGDQGKRSDPWGACSRIYKHRWNEALPDPTKMDYAYLDIQVRTRWPAQQLPRSPDDRARRRELPYS